MNKGQLIEAVQKNLGKDTSKAAAEAAVNAVFASITKAVKKSLFKSSVSEPFGCKRLHVKVSTHKHANRSKLKHLSL